MEEKEKRQRSSEAITGHRITDEEDAQAVWEVLGQHHPEGTRALRRPSSLVVG